MTLDTRVALILCWCGALQAQTPTPQPADSRASEIEAARAVKAKDLYEQPPSKFGSLLGRFTTPFQKIEQGEQGLKLRIGGLPSYSGLSAGPEYIRNFADGKYKFDTSAVGSLHQFWRANMSFDATRLANGLAFANLYTEHFDYARVDFYGEGPRSSRHGRSNYSLENTTFQASAGVQDKRLFRVGVSGQYLLVNVGPGQEEHSIGQTSLIYSPLLAPGIDRQTNYLRAGAFTEINYLDRDRSPSAGGFYRFEYSIYDDRLLKTGSFNRYSVDARQYLPFWNNRRLIALRFRTIISDPHNGQFVPFYMQPTLGSSDTLRGFRPYRFYDNNSVLFNGEYRWNVFESVQIAAFADAGKVFHRASDFDLAHLEGSFGAGIRVMAGGTTAFRIDVGASREGVQLWLKFAGPF